MLFTVVDIETKDEIFEFESSQKVSVGEYVSDIDNEDTLYFVKSTISFIKKQSPYNTLQSVALLVEKV